MYVGFLVVLISTGYYVGWVPFNDAVVTLLAFVAISLGKVASEHRRG